MSYKLDIIISQLDEINQRLAHIESLVDYTDDEGYPDNVDEAFEKVFGTKKPKLTVVEDTPTNVVDFSKDE